MGVIISYCTCSPLAYAAHACLHLFDLSNVYCVCVILVTIPQLPVHVHVSLVKHCSSYFSSDCLLLILTPVITDCMHTLSSSQFPGAAEEIQPMLFTESASTPTISSTPCSLAPQQSCESKSCDFQSWNILLLICPWMISKPPHT